jgi:hypothetical protein
MPPAKPLRVNTWPWFPRLPAKWALFGLTVVVVLFPYPGALVRHVDRWRDPNVLIEPAHPAIQAMADELRPALDASLPPAAALKKVELHVLKRLPYAWDWITWGMADYIPTVDEALAMGREDCDGRAVVAASVLQALGYRAELVTDFAHVWVKTDQGETMGPRPTTTIVATPDGPKLQKSALAALIKASAYGVAVFPLVREVIIAAAAWVLLWRPGRSRVGWVVAGGLIFGGLLLMRRAGGDDRNPLLWMQLVALGLWAVALLATMKRRRGAPDDAPPRAGLEG